MEGCLCSANLGLLLERRQGDAKVETCTDLRVLDFPASRSNKIFLLLNVLSKIKRKRFPS